MSLIRLPMLIGCLHLSGMWLGVDPRMDMDKNMCLKRLDSVLNICRPI